jgi:protein-S-isoprenylcysteine O-methyltransferase Ste14
MTPVARLIFLAVSWIVWLVPFVTRRPSGNRRAVQIAKNARWGILLQSAAYFVTYTHTPVVWDSELPVWRFAVGAVLAIAGIMLARTAVRALGNHWRVDAGLSADHELVRSGPYRILRHPIYAAMFCMILMGIAVTGTWPGSLIAVAMFIAGTEIRVRVEDGLLRGRFQTRFDDWRRTTPAYIPFLR